MFGEDYSGAGAGSPFGDAAAPTRAAWAMMKGLGLVPQPQGVPINGLAPADTPGVVKAQEDDGGPMKGVQDAANKYAGLYLLNKLAKAGQGKGSGATDPSGALGRVSDFYGATLGNKWPV